MMIRRMFAGSIAALLLTVSPLSAACALSCAFPSTNADCHSQKAEVQGSAPSGMAMDEMAMPGMTMPEMSGGQDQAALSASSNGLASHPSVGEMGPCERQSCDGGSAVTTRMSRSADSRLHFIVAIAETSRADLAPQLFHGAREDITDDHPCPVSPLQLSLRI